MWEIIFTLSYYPRGGTVNLEERVRTCHWKKRSPLLKEGLVFDKWWANVTEKVQLWKLCHSAPDRQTSAWCNMNLPVCGIRYKVERKKIILPQSIKTYLPTYLGDKNYFSTLYVYNILECSDRAWLYICPDINPYIPIVCMYICVWVSV